jgi:hypothetical protein
MSYNYSKGAQVIGDLKAADDAQRNTLIDFGEDMIDFQTSGSVRLQVNNDGVYIPDSAQDASLFVSGGIQLTPGNQEGIRFTNKGNNELNFISFQEGSEGGSYNARLGYNAAEYIFIAPGRGGDFFVNTAKTSGNATYPFSIMDDGTAKFQKGLEDSNTRAADLASDIAFYVDGTTDGNNNALFVGNVVMSGGLNIHGDLEVAQKIIHAGDANTLINFADDKIILKAGGKAMITMEEKGSAPHEITLNDGGNNIDFVIKGNGSNEGNPLLMCDASTGRVGINGVGSPSWELDVDGDIGLAEYIYHRTDTDTFIKFGDDTITLKAGGKSMIKASGSAGSIFVNNGGHDIDFVVRNAVTGTLLHTDAANSRVGIGTATPGTALDVHHDPTSLANDTGGGEVVKFGSGTLTAGKLYYLSGSTWTETDADGVLQGADQLLGIALGSNPTANGVLLRGFFDANSYLSNFSAGKAVYISTTGGGMDTTAPSGGGDYVRIVGYCTTTANVIYFNPSTTWVEL